MFVFHLEYFFAILKLKSFVPVEHIANPLGLLYSKRSPPNTKFKIREKKDSDIICFKMLHFVQKRLVIHSVKL